ncbi:MAG: (d)CMP kinase [Muribaculaceae bacterium]|nr:(d)CMP kinase [Muribaculaceae bacterium]MDE5930670.1 (d)CMP kinase [Muribaculaceae bacterium]
MITIAIDGFSSSGKSTMARHLAATIGYRYIDSGAMYRAVTLYALRNGWASPAGVDTASLTAALPDIDIDFLPQPDGTQHTLLNGEDVEALIRGIEVSEAVSPVAAVPEVRHALVAMQQRLGAGGGIVMDGRDIGTTVFPNAELKVYVDASAETRARRRYDEMTAKGIDVDYDEILANVRNRDHIDTTRSESPLRKADDAVLLDNSDMTPEQQNARLLELYNQAIQQSRAKNRD